MPSDIEIVQRIRPRQIAEIAKSCGIRNDELTPYGDHIAKVSLSLLKRLRNRPNGKLILVTCMTPTKHGEGKTSTAIGLVQALGLLKKKAILCLREPSLGPMFGVKGGACGGGYSQVIPMEDINLHFTGDGYAVSGANNLLCAILDNHIYFGNKLNIDPKTILIRRTIDISDRTLRNIEFKINKKVSYSSGFDIIAASEIMAILALSKDLDDLKKRLSQIIVAFDRKGKPITPKCLGAVGAMSALLTNAIMPNLVQTIEGQGALVHCGPFANIAHGANSLISTFMALKLGNYVVTESGFGADLGAEKFFNIVCRQGRLKADLAVIVVSARALKVHGIDNVSKHVDIVRGFGVKPVIVVNKFPEDSHKSLERIKGYCGSLNVTVCVSEAVTKGGAGALKLAEACVRLLKDEPSEFKFLYNERLTIKDKIEALAKEVYGALGVNFSQAAKSELRKVKALGLERLAVNIAKTQFSLSDNPRLEGAPKDWRLKIKDIRIFAGAGFIVPVCGNIMLMPGLPKRPAAWNISTDNNGKIKGLF